MNESDLKAQMLKDLGVDFNYEWNYPPQWISYLVDRLIDEGWTKK